MAAFIARSALASFLLEVAQLNEPGLRGVKLDFAPTTFTRCNWRVVSVDIGLVDAARAQAAVAAAVRANSAWIMVEDDDPRDGRQVSDCDSGSVRGWRPACWS